jgi:hypothetical protein
MVQPPKWSLWAHLAAVEMEALILVPSLLAMQGI